MEREDMYEKGRPSCAGRFGGYIFEMMNILRTAMDFFLRVEVVKNFGKEAELFLPFFDEVAVAAPLTGASTPVPGG